MTDTSATKKYVYIIWSICRYGGYEVDTVNFHAAYDNEEEAQNNKPKSIPTDYGSIKFDVEKILIGHKTVEDIEEYYQCSDSD